MGAVEIPAFSWFSAISEVFVTIGVLYSIVVSMRGGKFPKAIMGFVLMFEVSVNVVYMAGRAAAADTSGHYSENVRYFLMGHGIGSAVMIFTLVIMYFLALGDLSAGRDVWFRRNIKGSWIIIFFWMASVLSGHYIFYATYFGGGLGS